MTLISLWKNSGSKDYGNKKVWSKSQMRFMTNTLLPIKKATNHGLFLSVRLHTREARILIPGLNTTVTSTTWKTGWRRAWFSKWCTVTNTMLASLTRVPMSILRRHSHIQWEPRVTWCLRSFLTLFSLRMAMCTTVNLRLSTRKVCTHLLTVTIPTPVSSLISVLVFILLWSTGNTYVPSAVIWPGGDTSTYTVSTSVPPSLRSHTSTSAVTFSSGTWDL